MNSLDKIKIRIIIARSVGVDPDYVRVIDAGQKDRILYALDEFKGHNICLSFDHVPTVEEAREHIKSLYLCGVEWEFDDEMKFI